MKTQCTEHPVIFSTPMVKSLQNNTKLMTRRILKPQPTNHYFQSLVLHATGRYQFAPNDGNYSPTEKDILEVKCPYGKKGDLLYVRERFRVNPIPTGYPYHYYADDDVYTDKDSERWKPSIHMPKAAARIWLRITNIRVERLQNITDADALKEGIEIELNAQGQTRYKDYASVTTHWVKPTSSFQSLWASINGVDSWDENPWIWVIEFERIDKNTMYLVELEKEVWLANCAGDPGRTLKKENAKQFENQSEALNALTQARMYRQFKDAQILPVNPIYSPGL